MVHAEIVLRQQQLLLRSGSLRQRLASEADLLRRPLATMDLAFTGLRWLYQHPAWPVGAFTLWTVLRPARALTLVRRAWWVYRIASRWRQWSTILPKFLN